MQLIINLTETEHALLTTKAGKHDLEQIAKIALDNHFQVHRYSEENTVPLDLSKRGRAIAGLEAARPDPRKPLPPNRGEFQEDADYEAAVKSYEWNLAKYEAEQATFARKRATGTINEFGGRCWVN
ncbi:MAG: hypothetical protein RI964_2339 [Pseudomonadota bacterium]|jgi:hypothetical protein